MFKVPEWGEDIPKSNVNFTRAAPKQKSKNKNKKTKVPEVKKQNGFVKPSLKARNNVKVKSKLTFASKRLNSSNNTNQQSQKAPETNITKHKKKKQKKKSTLSKTKDETMKKSEGSLVLNHYDTDKLDELILHEKKKKLNSPKSVDIEEALFTEKKASVEKQISMEQSNVNVKIKSEKKKDKLNKNLEESIAKSESLEESSQKNVNSMKSSVEPKSNGVLNGKVSKSKKKKDKLKKNLNESIKKLKPKKESLIKTENSVKTKLEQQNDVALNGQVNKSNKKKTKLKKYIEESINNTEPCTETVNPIKSKVDHKKEVLKSLLQTQNHRNSINISKTSTLRERMLERLKAAKFRYLNEKLYTSSGADAKQLFQSDPEAFQTYHEGYQQQVKKWPVKPLDVIIQRIQKMPKSHTVADMGCGEAELSHRVPHTVRSFDLVSTSPGVEACDMAHTPLLSGSMDAVVYCLALMGTDLVQYLVEANRVLKVGGHLLIAEVESRFDNVENFTKDVLKLGFTLKKLDKTHKVFFFMEFTKVRESPVKKAKLPTLTLKPCIYKKR